MVQFVITLDRRSLHDSCCLAQHHHGRRKWQSGLRLLDHGKARHGLALGVVGGALGEMRLLIVLIAFWLSYGDGHRQWQATQEAFEIGSVLTGGINANVEVRLGCCWCSSSNRLRSSW